MFDSDCITVKFAVGKFDIRRNVLSEVLKSYDIVIFLFCQSLSITEIHNQVSNSEITLGFRKYICSNIQRDVTCLWKK